MSESNRPVLLIGSVNLASRDDVFAGVSNYLKEDVRSVPDGETGDRKGWVSWETNRMKELPGIQLMDEMVFKSPAGEFRSPRMEAEEGVDLSQVEFGPFHYADEAIASYETFKQDREDGKFAAGTRFQVSIPTPMMFAMVFPKGRLDALQAFERDLEAEIAKLVDAIPPADLALQWDVCGEIVILDQFKYDTETWNPEDTWPLEEATESIARVSAALPEQALMGIHLCYGDPDGTHMVEPHDLGLCVEFANSVSELTGRRIDWLHMPVPIERDDEAYFAPLANLKLQPETTLYLGLVHKEDGVEGAGRRIGAAGKFADGFGVATECGMGREPRDQVDGLLRLHHEAAAA